jgi:hypothetical protein
VCSERRLRLLEEKVSTREETGGKRRRTEEGRGCSRYFDDGVEDEEVEEDEVDEVVDEVDEVDELEEIELLRLKRGMSMEDV